jgi:hypothetical protein
MRTQLLTTQSPAAFHTEKRIKILNPERINRLLQRVCEANLQILLRTPQNTGVVVKGLASTLVPYSQDETNSTLMEIGGLSEKGFMFLANKSEIQVEFLMMATKVIFRSKIVIVDYGFIRIEMPHELVAIERRSNARYRTSPDLMAFINVSLWYPEDDDYSAPPCLKHFSEMKSWITLVDLSLGGFCAETKFPSVAHSIGKGDVDQNAFLILPMQAPIKVNFEVKWSKKIKEHVPTDQEDHVRCLKSYKFGCEYVAIDDKVQLSLQKFFKQSSQAMAV